MQANKKLEIRNLCKDYEKNIPVVSNLSFDVYDGEFLSILGSSGCGKTTLLRMLIGVLQPTSGSIFKDGEDITKAHPSKRGMGIVFQNYALFENMTVSIPVSNATKLGLREIVPVEKLDEVAAVLHEVPDVQSVKSISWNRRFQVYMEKIKSGCIIEVAKVFKILFVLEKDKKISVGERRMLHNAKQILQSEIMLIKNIDAAQAEAWLKECC